MTVEGTVAPGFEPVRHAFAANFTELGELGSEVAICRDGELVVDLFGGHMDWAKTRPWTEDAIVALYSVTKGMAASCTALLHSRGFLDYDEEVQTYWPAFAQSGKERITVRQLLGHRAGLSALDVTLDPDRIADHRWLSDALARQAPQWEPGTRQGYHGFSFGSYAGELVRHVDPQGRRIARFFQDEIAGPLGVSLHMGLPKDMELARLAPMVGFSIARLLLHMHELPWRMVLGLMWPRSLVARTMLNPRVSDTAAYDAPAYRHLEFPSAVGYGQARGVARVYGDMVAAESRVGFSRDTVGELTGPWQPPSGGSRDLVMGTDSEWHLGFGRSSSLLPYRTPRCFGVRGASGADGFADPDARLGFGFTTTRCSFNAFGEPRVQRLIEAMYRCLEAGA